MCFVKKKIPAKRGEKKNCTTENTAHMLLAVVVAATLARGLAFSYSCGMVIDPQCVDLRSVLVLRFDASSHTRNRAGPSVPQLNCTNCLNPPRKIKCERVHDNGLTAASTMDDLAWSCVVRDRRKVSSSQLSQARVFCERCSGEHEPLVVFRGSCHLVYQVPEVDNIVFVFVCAVVVGCIAIAWCCPQNTSSRRHPPPDDCVSSDSFGTDADSDSSDVDDT